MRHPFAEEPLVALEDDIRQCIEQGVPSLQFPPALEKRFVEENLDGRRNHLFKVGLYAIVVFNMFLIVDYVAFPHSFWQALFIRAGVITPLTLFCLFGLKKIPLVIRASELVAAFLVYLFATAIPFLTALGMPPRPGDANIGVIMVMMFSAIVLRLRFWYAVMTFVAILLCYSFSLSIFVNLSSDDRLTYTLTVLLGLSIGLFGTYTLERDLRRDYLYRCMLRIEGVHLESAKQELERLSTLDALTGIANRRYFDAALNNAWRQGILSHQPVSVLLVDVDHFKLYNDNYGHQLGDKSLYRVAHTIQNSLHRASDVAARYGGEEFVVLLPDTPLDRAIEIAERIRGNVQTLNIPHEFSGSAPQITVSIGVGSFVPPDNSSAQLILEHSDVALYRAKEMGRNRVCAASGSR